MPHVIRLGDPTSHGGKVISACAIDYLVDGIASVRMEDLCSCPVCGPGVSKDTNESTLALTLRLIAKIALEAK